MQHSTEVWFWGSLWDVKDRTMQEQGWGQRTRPRYGETASFVSANFFWHTYPTLSSELRGPGRPTSSSNIPRKRLLQTKWGYVIVDSHTTLSVNSELEKLRLMRLLPGWQVAHCHLVVGTILWPATSHLPISQLLLWEFFYPVSSCLMSSKMHTS